MQWKVSAELQVGTIQITFVHTEEQMVQLRLGKVGHLLVQVANNRGFARKQLTGGGSMAKVTEQRRCVKVTCKSQPVTWPACTSIDFTWQRGSVRSYITFSKGFPASDCYKLASNTFYLHSRHLPYFW